MALLCYIVCNSSSDIAVRITISQALPDPKAHMSIFLYAKCTEATDNWGGCRNGFQMPNSVLEHIPVLDYKATWIYWWSKRGGTKIRLN